MRTLLCILLAAGVSGCGIVYKLPTRQGNVIEQEKLDRIELGMNRSQIRFLLGTPLAASPFAEDRWDYLGYYRSPRGEVRQRVISLHFEGDRLVRADGLKPSSGEDADVAEPEAVREDLGDTDRDPALDGESPPERLDTPVPEPQRT